MSVFSPACISEDSKGKIADLLEKHMVLFFRRYSQAWESGCAYKEYLVYSRENYQWPRVLLFFTLLGGFLLFLPMLWNMPRPQHSRLQAVGNLAPEYEGPIFGHH